MPGASSPGISDPRGARRRAFSRLRLPSLRCFWVHDLFERLLPLPPGGLALLGREVHEAVPISGRLGAGRCLVQVIHSLRSFSALLQGPDLNRRPPGRKPGELASCSTLRCIKRWPGLGGGIGGDSFALPPHRPAWLIPAGDCAGLWLEEFPFPQLGVRM